ncbi:cytochrome P450 4C1-like isoform X2 [Centruroides sculpturatus]|uniref:cytochrome P450 4C1-like isoform X2 n=1 Tax=Centruroides sculpturatus TaxID=218467 RepID=UPI000C6CC042|nr:cytochrome P450 4C1-like isoform X2 [Centruroides sculpturatus]
MITPTFHYRILDQFIPIFDKNSKIFVTNLKEYLDKEWIDVTHLVNLCTLDIISETAMGIEMKSQNKNKGYYLNALQEFCDIFMVRCMKPWLYSDFIFSHTSDGKKIKEVISILHDFTSKILKQRKEELKKEKTREKNCSEICEDKRKEPLLNTLIKYQFENCNFTDKDICEELDTFLFEGHDTTSVGICWVLYYLGLYPNIQQKVYEELLQIFGGDKDRPITTQDIKDMKYLECVLKMVILFREELLLIYLFMHCIVTRKIFQIQKYLIQIDFLQKIALEDTHLHFVHSRLAHAIALARSML